MRVLLLTHRLPYTPNRGDRIRAFHIFHQLAQRHEVHLVSLVHDADEAAHTSDLESAAASVTGVRVSRRARLLPAAFGLAGQQPLTHLLLHSGDVSRALDGLVSRATPDVVVAYCTGMARYALEPPLSGLPWILDMVDVDSEKWAALSEEGGPAALLYRREARLLRRFERRAMQSAAATTVVSDKERALLEQIAPESPVSVVSNGIDLESFAPPGPPADSQDVVFCGVFDYAPNEAAAVWLATDIWPRVLKARPDARLRLVGMNPTRAVRALASDPTIEVTGAVPDVRPYLWRAALAVAPLRVARGVQNKVLEALGAGIPCVVTPAVFEGLPQSARDGCLAASDAPGVAAALIEQLLESPDARRRRATTANLSQLSWPRQLAPLIELIEAAPTAGRARPATK